MRNPLFCAIAAAAAALFAAPSYGITINAIGDSITKGQGSFETGGYRQFLDQKLGDSFQFIGKRRDENQPVLGDWQYHNGYGGYQASSITVPDRSIHKRYVDDQIISKIGRPDVILLHVGTNTIGYADPRSSSEDYTLANDKADTQLYRILDYLGKACPTTKIVVARILPKATTARNLADTYKYNFGGTDGKGGIPGVIRKLASSITSRISFANMFQINLNAVGRSDLIGNSQVDPDKDGIVDWVKGFNEFDFYSSWGTQGANTALLYDGVHPTRLGYELMAAEWYRAMRAAGLTGAALNSAFAAAYPGMDYPVASVNPTPTAAGLGLAMVLGIAGKRRRKA